MLRWYVLSIMLPNWPRAWNLPTRSSRLHWEIEQLRKASLSSSNHLLRESNRHQVNPDLFLLPKPLQLDASLGSISMPSTFTVPAEWFLAMEEFDRRAAINASISEAVYGSLGNTLAPTVKRSQQVEEQWSSPRKQQAGLSLQLWPPVLMPCWWDEMWCWSKSSYNRWLWPGQGWLPSLVSIWWGLTQRNLMPSIRN